MTKRAVLKLLKFCDDRGKVASESCNSAHISAILNQMRGAIWYATGKDPGAYFNDVSDVAKILGVKFKICGDTIEFPDYPSLKE